MFIRCKRVMHIKYVAERFANWRQRKDQLVIKVSCHHQTNSLLSRYDCFDMKTKTEQKQKQKEKKKKKKKNLICSLTQTTIRNLMK